MEMFLRLFGGLLSLVYHCFDRIVIFGYLPLLSRPEPLSPYCRIGAPDSQGLATFCYDGPWRNLRCVPRPLQPPRDAATCPLNLRKEL